MEEYSLRNQSNQTKNDDEYKDGMNRHFTNSSGTNIDKLNNFSRFVSRQSISIFLAKNEIFQKIINVHGNIVECGVFMGGGLFNWAQLSSIYEPVNHNRKVIGFDSFDGFPSLASQDRSDENDEHKIDGSYAFRSYDDLVEGVRLYDLNRSIGHVPKIELVSGDAIKTIPAYIKDNPHLIVSLLYLDFDLYEPTKKAIEYFVPRMPKGAIIAFDELNQKQWPGETLALLDTLGINSLEIKRFPFSPALSYAVIS